MIFSRLIPRLQKAVKHPSKAYNYVLWKLKERFLWDYYYKMIREPKIKSFVPVVDYESISRKLKKASINVIDYTIDVTDYYKYINDAEYKKVQKYYGVGGKGDVFSEKSLEHYLAAKFLELTRKDTYIDVANAFSPVPEIYRSLYGCEVYSQDLIFENGIHDGKIGGDAGNMPVVESFASKLALHCSFEHFEHDADIRFIKEANRVLKKGGKLCILPLYLSENYFILTDPTVIPKNEIPFENDVTLHCAKGYGNRHGRFYDVENFITRIVNHLSDLNLTIYVIQNEKDIDYSCYVKFVALLEKK